jgi:hypothetical protein
VDLPLPAKSKSLITRCRRFSASGIWGQNWSWKWKEKKKEIQNNEKISYIRLGHNMQRLQKPNFVNLGKLGPSLPSLTNFNRIWPSLLIFKFFYPISHVISVLTRKIIRFYESTCEFDNHA